MRKVATVTAVVVLLHLVVLWAVGTGLSGRPEKMVVPVAMVMLAPPSTKPTSHAAPATTSVAPAKAPAKRPKTEQTAAAPPALEVPDSPAPVPEAPALTPSANAAAAPTAQTAANAPSGVALPSAKSALPGGSAHATPSAVELPSSEAQYLHNPKPTYPRASRLRGEQGRVVVNVLIGTDGTAQQAEIKVSSGFERLDLAALRTAKAWRYVPGKRGGVPEAMWYAVPLNFVMEGE